VLPYAIDLSKKWPQALLRFGLGATFFSLVLSWSTGSTTDWIDKITAQSSNPQNGSAILAVVMIVGASYVFGSILAASGETLLLGSNTDYRIRLAADVFDTQNAMLIEQYQDARRNAQLFGGLLNTFVLGGLVIWFISLLKDDGARLLSEVYGIGGAETGTSAQSTSVVWWQVILAAIFAIAFLESVRRTVKQITWDSFIAIAVEVKLRKPTEDNETK